MVFAKGQFVKITTPNNGDVFGVVNKVDGVKVKVNVGLKGNQLHSYNLHATKSAYACEEVTLEAMGNHHMSAYEVRGHKTMDGQDGYMMNCNIYKNGKKCLAVTNGGYGGPNDYHPHKGFTYADVKAFGIACSEWAKANGHDSPHCNDECWIEWVKEASKYGTTAKNYLLPTPV
jgi:hypothetical protein